MLRLLFISLWLTMHPVHVTLMSIEYDEEKSVFNAFLQVYFDDFLIDYNYLEETVPDFDFNNGKEESIRLLDNYLHNRIGLMGDGRNLDFDITDATMSDNELKMNLIFRPGMRAKIFTVRNAILTDIYKDQSNLLIFKYDVFEEGVKLTAEKTDHVFNVN